MVHTNVVMKSQLKVFQKDTVDWMLKKELSDGGGLLLNEAGTGKTICCLNVIMNDDKKRTLVLCPAGLISNWLNEIKKHTGLSKENILVYSGKNRKELISGDYVVCLSSYSIITREFNIDKFEEGSIFGWKYDRVILDEAHYIRNYNRKIFKSVMRLDVDLKWVVTATPLFNDVNDIYSYFCFLGVAGVESRKDWKMFLSSGVINKYKDLNDMIKLNSLRMKKSVVLSDELCKKKIIEVSVELEDFERGFYDSLWDYSMTRMSVLSKRLKNLVGLSDVNARMMRKLLSNNILVYILRLKQCCNNPWLVISKMKRISCAKSLFRATEMLKFYNSSLNMEEECPVCYDSIADGIASPCGHKCCMGCWDKIMKYKIMKCPKCRCDVDSVERVELVNINNKEDSSMLECELKMSSKIKKLIEIIEEKRSLSEKIVIVSQWVKMLDIVKEMISVDIKSVSLRGDISLKERERLIRNFQEERDIEICYVSLMSSAEGINLTAANNLVLLDMWWNDSKMLQVSDRVHRIGQKREVNIYRMKVGGENSIEERVNRLIMKKEKLKNLILKNWDIKDIDNYDDDWIKTPIKLIG